MVNTSRAQDNIPALDKFNSGIDDFVLPIPEMDVSKDFVSSNPYFNETLKLHYQIGLLEKMIRRQSFIARLEKSYIELGIPFDEPSPPLGICEQIPANIPCARSYPDLYMIALPRVDSLGVLSMLPLNVDMVTQADPAKKALLSDQYRWSEILCGGGVCEASIVDTMNPSKVISVKEGDAFAGGKLRVEKILAQGVNVDENGTIHSLAFGDKEISDFLQTKPTPVFDDQEDVNDLEDELDDTIIPNDIDFPSMPQMPQPALGSTGLF